MHGGQGLYRKVNLLSINVIRQTALASGVRECYRVNRNGQQQSAR